MTEYALDMSEFLDLFIDESRQNLQALNQGMLALEQQPEDTEVIQGVFRAAHTLKGMAATMGYDHISQLSHALEDVLDPVRSHSDALTPQLISLVFRGIDAIDLLVASVADGGDGKGDVGAVLGALVSYAAGGGRPDEGVVDGGAAESAGFEQAPALLEDVEVLHGDAVDEGRAPTLDQAVAPDGSASAAVPATQDADVVDGPAPMVSVDMARSGPSHLVRLDVGRLDRLLDVVTEMVIHRSYLARLQARYELPDLDEALLSHSQMLDRLQAAVLDTRMVPIGQAFDRFPRMVRDLLRAQGKEADFVVRGAHVELDRTMLAAINDALVHLLRNAVDHGLEPPDVRIAAGKPRKGILRLTARAERNTVVIEVRDDGGGIDAARVARRALGRGLVTEQQLADMNEGEVLDLLCRPGFTLAEEVTAVSGRGVGMDAVAAQVASVRGSLEIETVLGHGSVFRMRVPVNLALTDAILVRIGTEHYAVPTSAVERVVEVEPEAVSRVGTKQLLTLGDAVVPLRHAREYLGGETRSAMPARALVTRRHDQIVAIGIDEVLGYEQVVAKPTPPSLAAISGLSGVTILGEGDVVFLLDLTQL